MKRARWFFICGLALLAAGGLCSGFRIGIADAAPYVMYAGILSIVIGIVVFLEGGKKVEINPHKSTRRLVMAGLFATLCYMGFQFFRIDIPIGSDGKTAVHLGNAFVVLAGLFLGGSMGGISGAIGLTFADLTAGYVTSMPKTFLTKFVIGAIAGILSERVFGLDRALNRKARTRKSACASGIALAANVFLDPLLGYLYKRYLFGIPQDAAVIFAKIGALTTFINAGISFVFVLLIYNAVYPALKKSGLL